MVRRVARRSPPAGSLLLIDMSVAGEQGAQHSDELVILGRRVGRRRGTAACAPQARQGGVGWSAIQAKRPPGARGTLTEGLSTGGPSSHA
jgi:hypothetical protein